MTAKEIVNEIIEKNNSDFTKEKLELKQEFSENYNYFKIQFGFSDENCVLIKENGEEIKKDVLEERCYRSLLNLMIHKTLIF